MSSERWWGEDVVPRIQWTIVMDALRLRRKVIGEGDMLPPGYGVAWRCWNRDAVVCMPVPLNALVGWLRWAWIELRHGLGIRPTRDEARLFALRLKIRADERERAEHYADRRIARELDAAYRRGWNDSLADLVRRVSAPSSPDTEQRND